MAGAVKDKVQDWGASAGETARVAATQIVDKAAAAAEGASQTLHEAGATARETLSQATEKAASLAERASTRLQEAMPDREDRDKYLLGAAALAVAAAVGIAYQRRTHGAGSLESREDEHAAMMRDWWGLLRDTVSRWSAHKSAKASGRRSPTIRSSRSGR